MSLLPLNLKEIEAGERSECRREGGGWEGEGGGK